MQTSNNESEGNFKIEDGPDKELSDDDILLPKIMIADDQDYNIAAIKIILKYSVKLDPKC